MPQVVTCKGSREHFLSYYLTGQCLWWLEARIPFSVEKSLDSTQHCSGMYCRPNAFLDVLGTVKKHWKQRELCRYNIHNMSLKQCIKVREIVTQKWCTASSCRFSDVRMKSVYWTSASLNNRLQHNYINHTSNTTITQLIQRDFYS